jgi:hypothetical protein
MASDRPEDVAPGVDFSTAGIVGLVNAPAHAGPAVAGDPDHHVIDAGVQIAAALMLGREGVQVLRYRPNRMAPRLLTSGSMGSIPYRQTLEGLIGRKLDDGDLPTKAPVRLEVHLGTGAMCDACGGRIRAIQIEHEFNYRDGRSFRLHFDCAALWVELRRRRTLDLAS